MPGELASRWQRDAEAFLAQRLGGVSPAGSSELETAVVAGDPFSSIIGEAAERRVGLIVIGEPSTLRYADMFTGTTAERVIRFSDRPVLMVKRQASGPYRRILAAFDGSEASVRALRTAIAIAPKAEFRVVHAWWPSQASLGDTEVSRAAIAKENDSLKALIHRAASETITSSHLGNVTIDMVENNPYLVMRNEVASSDLLVLGTHSKGRLVTTAAIGSLARHLLAEAACDVLVSRP